MDGVKLKRIRAALEFEATRRSCLQGQTLHSILGYVGAGSFLFIAGVSKGWRQSYESVDGCTTPDPRCHWNSSIPLARTTLMSAVFASPARVQLAATGEYALPLHTRQVAWLAGLHGSVTTLQAAARLGLPWRKSLLSAMARAGRLPELTWAYVAKVKAMPAGITNDAAVSGNVEVLKWLRVCKRSMTPKTSTAAAAAGHLSAVMYLHSMSLCDAETCHAAAEKGHLPILQWLILNGCDWNASDVACGAAAANDMPMLAWLKEQGVVFNTRTMSAAAREGHLSLCQHLHAEQCPWDVHACYAAAQHQHVDTLRWLREHGCPWTAAAICWQAKRSQYWSVLRYVFEPQGGAGMTEAELIEQLHSEFGRGEYLPRSCFNYEPVYGSESECSSAVEDASDDDAAVSSDQD
eukprot:2607-Heterococcus_DN1.PRE.4